VDQSCYKAKQLFNEQLMSLSLKSLSCLIEIENKIDGEFVIVRRPFSQLLTKDSLRVFLYSCHFFLVFRLFIYLFFFAKKISYLSSLQNSGPFLVAGDMPTVVRQAWAEIFAH